MRSLMGWTGPNIGADTTLTDSGLFCVPGLLAGDSTLSIIDTEQRGGMTPPKKVYTVGDPTQTYPLIYLPNPQSAVPGSTVHDQPKTDWDLIHSGIWPWAFLFPPVGDANFDGWVSAWVDPATRTAYLIQPAHHSSTDELGHMMVDSIFSSIKGLSGSALGAISGAIGGWWDSWKAQSAALDAALQGGLASGGGSGQTNAHGGMASGNGASSPIAMSSTNTILLLGAAALGAYFLTRKA
jgi:hypothetical protein